MKQYDTIIATGCSYTFGSEILGMGNTSIENKALAYPQLLADRLGAQDVVNLSRCGASNDRIYYELAAYLLANRSRLIGRRILVIVQWTYWNRVMLFSPINPQAYGDVLLSTMRVEDRDLDTHARVVPWYRALTGVYTDYLALDPRNTLNVVYNTHLLKFFTLASMGTCDFVYWNAQQIFPNTIPTSLAIDYRVSDFYQNNVISRNVDWHEYMRTIVPNATSGFHFSQPAHQAWAGLLYDYLNTDKQIQ